VAAPYCGHCGQPLSEGAIFCGSCGAPTPAPASTAAPLPTGAPLRGPGPPAYVYAGGWAQPAHRGPFYTDADLRALPSIRLAAILGLIASVFGLAAETVSNATNFLSFQTTYAGMGPPQTYYGPGLALSTLWLLAGLAVLTATFEIVEILLVRSAFSVLSEVDRELATPARLSLLALIGGLVAVAGGTLLVVALVHAVQCAGAGLPIPQGCLFTGEFWAGFGLLVVGAVLALVGLIGILIGLWRLGTRYDDVLIKIGTILLIIPVASIGGNVLILIGAERALERARLALRAR